MSYTVRWRLQAEAALLAVLDAAHDKQAVLGSSGAATDRLRRRPLTVGESRDDSHRRIAFLWPLCVLVTVDRAERIVYIEQMRWIGSLP